MELVEENGYHLACFKSKGRRIWVMLDPKEPPYYKQLPKTSYKLTAEQFERIKGGGFTNITVLECLMSHLVDG